MSKTHRNPEPDKGPAYGFSCELTGRDFPIAITRVTEAV